MADSVNRIPCAMSGLPIPMFSVQVKDPIIGWQTVGVAHELNLADAIYDNWRDNHPTVPIVLKEADESVPQVWCIVRNYRGGA